MAKSCSTCASRISAPHEMHRIPSVTSRKLHNYCIGFGYPDQRRTRCEPDARRRYSRCPATNARVLLAITRSCSLPAALTLRAKIVFAGLCGEPAEEKAHRAVRLGQDDRRTCAAMLRGVEKLGFTFTLMMADYNRSPSMSGNGISKLSERINNIQLRQLSRSQKPDTVAKSRISAAC